MSNPLKEFTLKVDGVERQLRFDLSALATLQDWLETENSLDIFRLPLFSFKLLPTTIAAGLKHEWQEVTPDIIARANIAFNQAIDTVTRAFNLAMTGVEVKEDSPLSMKETATQPEE